MSALLGPGVDRDLASHLSIAVRAYRAGLQRRGLAVHPALVLLEKECIARVSDSHGASPGVTVRRQGHDDVNDREFLTRADIRRITGLSLSTIDRRIRDGWLPSVKTGGIRRVKRSDLEQCLVGSVPTAIRS